MKPVRLLSVALGSLAFSVALLPVACGDSSVHPTPVNTDQEGGIIPAVPKEAGPDVGIADVARPDVVSDSGGDATTDAAPDVDAGPPGCNNTVKDPLETDVDCGGPVCQKCIDGKTCVTGTDCVGGSCVLNDAGTGNVCITPSCTDKVKNGQETDVDCGGPTCPRCTLGKTCGGGGDCVSSNCASSACACPPRMVVVATSAALGGAYCVDETEVDNGQYNAFIQANQPIATQITQCQANTTFVPQGDWPPPQPLTSFGLPVHYVDWCDAFAYCKWAGKQLCGQIGGGTLSYTSTAANDKSQSAWYNACSAQGVNQYPYHITTFSSTACNGGPGALPDGGAGPWGVWNYDGSGNNQNSPQNVGCQGGTVNLFQMSGNVAEWEDSCSGAAGGGDTCRLRGGSFLSNDSPTDLACTGDRTATRLNPDVNANPTLYADVGFRCCQY